MSRRLMFMVSVYILTFDQRVALLAVKVLHKNSTVPSLRIDEVPFTHYDTHISVNPADGTVRYDIHIASRGGLTSHLNLDWILLNVFIARQRPA